MWLTSYDIEPAWGPIEANLVGEATIGERTDWALATVEPALRMNGDSHLRVLLGARHRGDSVWSEPERWPMHVYVCLTEPGSETSSVFSRDQVTIESWGLLHQSRGRAVVDHF